MYMKNNKGFALITTLLIILGVLVVAGGIYYLGTTRNTGIVPIDNETYYPPINQNNTPPVTNNSPQTNPPVNSNPPQETVSDLCSGITQATIIIDHPVANQTFSTSAPFNVKWHTCNIPTTHRVYIGLMPVGEFQGAPPMIILSSSTTNDGTETFTLSNLGVSADTYTIFMKDNNLPNGTTNAWSGQFNITTSTVSQSTSCVPQPYTGPGGGNSSYLANGIAFSNLSQSVNSSLGSGVNGIKVLHFKLDGPWNSCDMLKKITLRHLGTGTVSDIDKIYITDGSMNMLTYPQGFYGNQSATLTLTTPYIIPQSSHNNDFYVVINTAIGSSTGTHQIAIYPENDGTSDFVFSQYGHIIAGAENAISNSFTIIP